MTGKLKCIKRLSKEGIRGHQARLLIFLMKRKNITPDPTSQATLTMSIQKT